MNEVVLTGISNDIDMDGGSEGRFYLVFNGGELRVPVNMEAIEAVLRFRQSMKKLSAVKEYENGHTNSDYDSPPREQPDDVNDGQVFGGNTESPDDEVYDEPVNQTFETQNDEDGVPSI